MKNKKTIATSVFLIIMTMLFFTYQVVITYDSSHYLWLASLMTKERDFATWDVARGPIFPLFIRICQLFFGQNNHGLLVGMFAFYLVMLFFSYLIYKDTIAKEEVCSNQVKGIFIVSFLLIVAINPMIIGYYHTLLTEFMAITFAIIGCYFAWKWMQLNFVQNKKKYVIYTIAIAILTAIAWQLKQPYVGTILFPVVIAAILSFIRKVSIKNLLQRAMTILVCIIMLIIGIKSWDFILKTQNVAIKEERTSAGFLASGLVGGIKEYTTLEEFHTVEAIQESNQITLEDKEQMVQVLQHNSEYQSFMVMDTKQENYEIIYLKGEIISTTEAVKFLINSLMKHPGTVIGNYINNYFLTISMYPISFEGTKVVQVGRKLDFINTEEINSIGFKIYEYGISPVFPLSEQYEPYANVYRETNKPIVAINWILTKLKLPSTFAMKISYLALPFLTIGSIIVVFRTKKRYQEKYTNIIDMIAILYGFSFLHILAHSMLGSTIDRYTMPALATTFIAILLSLYAIFYRKKYKIDKK